MGNAAPMRPRDRVGHWALTLVAILIVAFLVLPILIIFPLSFTSGTLLIYPLPGFSLRWYQDFLTNPFWVNSTRNSIVVAVIVTATATTLGTTAALGALRLSARWRRIVGTVFLVPLIVPLIIVAVASFFFFSQIGLASSMAGLVLAHTALALPFVFIITSATLNGYDRNLTRAAMSLGARPLRTFFTVILPTIWPGLASGAMLAFITSFDEVVVALFLSGPEFRTLPRQLWSGVRESITPTITSAAVVLIIVTVVGMLIAEILRRRATRRNGAPRHD